MWSGFLKRTKGLLKGWESRTFITFLQKNGIYCVHVLRNDNLCQMRLVRKINVKQLLVAYVLTALTYSL